MDSSPRNRPKLEGWINIADYLGVRIRAAQRWEQLGLPVHRSKKTKKSRVFAFAEEIDAWSKEQETAPSQPRTTEAEDLPAPSATAEVEEDLLGATREAGAGDQMPPALPAPAERRIMGPLLAASAILAVTAAAALHFSAAKVAYPVSEIVQITRESLPKSGPLYTDGTRIWFYEQSEREGWLASVPVSGGPTSHISVPEGLQCCVLLDARFPGPEFLLWAPDTSGIPTVWDWIPGRPAHPLVPNIRAAVARWGSAPNAIATVRPDAIEFLNGSTQTHEVRLRGRVEDLRFLASSDILRFSLYDLSGHPSIWETNGAAGIPRRVEGLPREARAGGWSADGSVFAFTAKGANGFDIWAELRKTTGARTLVRLTAGPIDYEFATPTPDGRRILAIGTQDTGELVRFEPDGRRSKGYLDRIDAIDLDFSRDERSVAYIRLPERALWKARADGGGGVRLTPPSMTAFQPHWSHDGSRIAFMGETPGTVNRIYIVSSGGGVPVPATTDGAEQGVPTWSPDGAEIVFGDRNHGEPLEMSIHVLNLKSGAIRQLPGSTGLWTPRWSPNGAYIAAISVDPPERLMLYECATRQWRNVAGFDILDNTLWSADSQYIYFRGIADDRKSGIHRSKALYRISASGGPPERLVNLDEFVPGPEEWFGLMPGGSLLGSAGVRIQQVYSVDIAK